MVRIVDYNEGCPRGYRLNQSRGVFASRCVERCPPNHYRLRNKNECKPASLKQLNYWLRNQSFPGPMAQQFLQTRPGPLLSAYLRQQQERRQQLPSEPSPEEVAAATRIQAVARGRIIRNRYNSPYTLFLRRFIREHSARLGM